MTYSFQVHHASPPCTGTSIVNNNINSGKLTAARLAYHRKCRKSVSNTRELLVAYRRGGFVKSKFTRSCSSEQPRLASFPRRGNWSSGMPRLVCRKPMQCSVYGCIVGQRLRGSKSGKQWPVCKAWVMQTDHPGLAGMLAQFSCPGDHQFCATLVERRSEDLASLSATASYPQALAYFFLLSLTLRWTKQRDSIV